MVATKDEIRRAVEAVLGKHRLSDSAAADRIGIDRATLARLRNGRASLEKVEQFARAFGLDVGEWREMFGYGDWQLPFNAKAALYEGLAEIARRTGKVVPFDPDRMLLQQETPDEVRRILRELEADLEEP